MMQREASGQVNKNVAVAIIEEAVREDMAPKIGAHSSHTQKKNRCHSSRTPHALEKKKCLTRAHYQAPDTAMTCFVHTLTIRRMHILHIFTHIYTLYQA
jgi:hypothetical protein